MGGKGTCAGPNDARLEHLFYEGLHGVFLRVWVAIRFHIDGWCVG
jgi:hypothetical protein